MAKMVKSFSMDKDIAKFIEKECKKERISFSSYITRVLLQKMNESKTEEKTE